MIRMSNMFKCEKCGCYKVIDVEWRVVLQGYRFDSSPCSGLMLLVLNGQKAEQD